MMLTGYADVASIVRAINEGRIYRYIPKPWEPDELRIDVRRALEAYALFAENAQLAARAGRGQRAPARREPLPAPRGRARATPSTSIIGASPAMQRVFDVMEKVAQTDATVLLTGRDRHRQGPRRARDPLRGSAAGAALRRAELRRAARHAARERALRPQARRLHRRPRRQEGPLRGRRRRHDLPRRDRRDGARHAGAPAARAAGRRDPPARLLRDAQGRRARHRRDEPRPAQGSSPKGASARTSTTGCASSRSSCRRCASAARTSRRSPTTSSTSPTRR